MKIQDLNVDLFKSIIADESRRATIPAVNANIFEVKLSDLDGAVSAKEVNFHMAGSFSKVSNKCTFVMLVSTETGEIMSGYVGFMDEGSEFFKEKSRAGEYAAIKESILGYAGLDFDKATFFFSNPKMIPYLEGKVMPKDPDILALVEAYKNVKTKSKQCVIAKDKQLDIIKEISKSLLK